MDVELVASLPTIERGDFTAGNQTVESKALANYFAISDYFQPSRHCVKKFGAMTLAATGKGANFTLEEIDELITIDFCRDI